MSPAVAKMVKTFKFVDSYKSLFLHDTTTKSHYYSLPKPGGTIIDRIYHHGLNIGSCGYVSVGSLSDHCAMVAGF